MKRRWVEVDVGRFLNRCETDGVRLVHCSPYMREWMSREQKNDRPQQRRYEDARRSAYDLWRPVEGLKYVDIPVPEASGPKDSSGRSRIIDLTSETAAL